MPSTKFTKAIRVSILDTLGKGNFVSVACALAGIHKTTYFDWIARGEAEADDPKSEHAKFVLDVEKAKATAEEKALSVIQYAAVEDKDWKAAAWFLARAYPDRWGAEDWRKPATDAPQDFVVELLPPAPPNKPPTDTAAGMLDPDDHDRADDDPPVPI